MSKTRILLIDDHTLFREGVSRLVASEPDMEMAGLCGTVGEGLEALQAAPIDLVLLDFDLGKENGVEFIARARRAGFRGHIVMLTAGMSDAEYVQALGLGVRGIVLKHNSPTLFARAIRQVMAGELWLDQSPMEALVAAAQPPPPTAPQRALTERERQVLQGVMEGLGNKEIAARLGVSESSVKATLQQLFQKTGVRTRSQLVRIALERYHTK
jgi:DNA-binding NarL/FixJ family response regulator